MAIILLFFLSIPLLRNIIKTEQKGSLQLFHKLKIDAHNGSVQKKWYGQFSGADKNNNRNQNQLAYAFQLE